MSLYLFIFQACCMKCLNAFVTDIKLNAISVVPFTLPMLNTQEVYTVFDIGISLFMLVVSPLSLPKRRFA